MASGTSWPEWRLILQAVSVLVVAAACGSESDVITTGPEAPTAEIEAPSRDTTVTLGDAVVFAGTASDADGTVVSHSWAFGDGTTSSVEDPGGYTYAGEGVYTVSYTVTDDEGATSATANRVVTVQAGPTNQAPTAEIEAPSQDTTVTLGDAVVFAGTASDADGTVVSHSWAFGDGTTSSVEDPGGYTYAGEGVYTVSYTVTDDEGATSATANRVVTVQAGPTNQAPTAEIEAPSQDTTVTLGDAVVFAGTASDADGTVVSHSWAFGDGTTSSVEDPGGYTYAGEGVYTVSYTVTDDEGATSATANRVVTVQAGPTNQAPTAEIEAPSQDTTVTLGDAVVFAGTASDADGTVVSHSWAFGDGTTSSVEDPGGYTYVGEGVYTVSYTVTDDEGATSATANRVVTVQAAGGGTNYALRFFGNGVNDIDRVKVLLDDPGRPDSHLPVDVGATDFTIEFWILADFDELTNNPVNCGSSNGWIRGDIVIDRDRLSADRAYGISLNQGAVAFGASGNGTGAFTLCGDTFVADSVWHHVAVTRERSSGALAIYVDGVRDAFIATGPGGDASYPDRYATSWPDSDPFVVFGAEKHSDPDTASFPSYVGALDEVRFSNVARYTEASFVVPTGRFTPDASTVGLYHFDEGSGDMIGDSSGAAGGPSHGVRRFGGSPAGPLWVVSGAPTGND